jgi:hypothetical protein
LGAQYRDVHGVPFSPCGRRWAGEAGSDEGVRTVPKGKSLQWSDLKDERPERERRAGQLGVGRRKPVCDGGPNHAQGKERERQRHEPPSPLEGLRGGGAATNRSSGAIGAEEGPGMRGARCLRQSPAPNHQPTPRIYFSLDAPYILASENKKRFARYLCLPSRPAHPPARSPASWPHKSRRPTSLVSTRNSAKRYRPPKAPCSSSPVRARVRRAF